MRKKTLPTLPFRPLNIIDGPRVHPTLEPNSVREDWSWRPTRPPAAQDGSHDAGTAAPSETVGRETGSVNEKLNKVFDIDNGTVPVTDAVTGLIQTRIIWDSEMQGAIQAFLEALAQTTITA
jgi:hypothetical protein